MLDLAETEDCAVSGVQATREHLKRYSVEHYEMTRYGTLISWAKELGRNDCVALLQQTLDEERATDRKLTAMAEGQVNRKAA